MCSSREYFGNYFLVNFAEYSFCEVLAVNESKIQKIKLCILKSTKISFCVIVGVSSNRAAAELPERIARVLQKFKKDQYDTLRGPG